jgi:hypothetical protein
LIGFRVIEPPPALSIRHCVFCWEFESMPITLSAWLDHSSASFVDAIEHLSDCTEIRSGDVRCHPDRRSATTAAAFRQCGGKRSARAPGLSSAALRAFAAACGFEAPLLPARPFRSQRMREPIGLVRFLRVSVRSSRTF